MAKKMMKKPTKKLSLHTETIRVMTSDHLQDVAGGSIIVRQTITCACPVLTTNLTTTKITQGCTIGSGTSVINPSGG